MAPESWSRRRVREFAGRRKVVNISGEELPPLSVTKARGVVLQSDRYKRQIATDLRKYVVVRRGQFAFDPMSLYYGAIGLVRATDRGLISPDYVAFETDESVDPHFLDYLLRAPEQVARYESVAEAGNQFGKRRRVYWSVLEELEFLLPPLPEQRKIAAILSSVDEAIEDTQAVIDQLQVVKKAMMADLLTRGIPGRHKTFKQTEIGEVPEEWEISRLGDVGNWLSGGTPSKLEPSLWTGPIPWVSPKDMKRPRISDAIDHVSEQALRRGTQLAPVGSVLMVVRGMILAHTFPVAVTVGPVAFNQDIKALVPAEAFQSDFMLYWLQERGGEILNLADVSNHGTKRLPSEQLFDSKVPRPSREEQTEIVEILRSFDARMETEQLWLLQLCGIRSALMSVLLTGEVRVRVDEEVAA